MTQSAVSQPFSTLSNLGALDLNDLTKLTVKLFAGRVFKIPMSAADIAYNFPDEYQVFRSFSGATDSRGTTVQVTNMMGGDEVPCPFLCCGFCVQITPDLEAWTLNGAVVNVNVPANAGPDTPAYDGNLLASPVAPAQNGIQQGVMEFGAASWRAAVEFLLAYNLRFMLQCKYELFNIPLTDIGCLDSASPIDAAGTSQVPAGPSIQEMNDLYRELNFSSRFLPPNVINSTPFDPATQRISPAPVAQAMRGGPVLRGGMSGWCLCPAPVLLAPCCRVNLSLTTNTGGGTSTSGGHLERLRFEVGDQSQNPRGYASEWSNGIISGATKAGAAYSYTTKLAHLDVKVLMIGQNMTLKACEQYYASLQAGEFASMMQNISGMPGLSAASSSFAKP